MRAERVYRGVMSALTADVKSSLSQKKWLRNFLLCSFKGRVMNEMTILFVLFEKCRTGWSEPWSAGVESRAA